MRVCWTTDAAYDLEGICDYVAEANAESARHVAKTVEGIASLQHFRIAAVLVESKAPASSY